MRNKYIENFVENEEIQDFFLVQESGSIIDGKRGPFGIITVGDKTDNITCKIWGIKEYKNKELLKKFESLQPGDIIKIKGTTNLYQETLQIIIEQLDLKTDNDIIDENDLYKMSPIPPNILYDKIIEIINTEITDIDYKKLCINLYTMHKNKILNWPAAKSMHHGYIGGLLWHTYRMSQLAISISNIYTCVNKSLLLAGTILHDIGKISELSFNNNAADYSFEGNMLGHILIGTMIINNEAKEMHMSKEKKLLLEHMVAAHHGDPSMGAPIKPRILEAYLLHEIDMIDSKTEKLENILKKMNLEELKVEKEYTDNNTYIYKPTFFDDNYLKGE